MNDTPRTDAVWKDKSQNILEHARTLERELAAVIADRDALLADKDRLDWLTEHLVEVDYNGDVRAAIDDARKEP